MEARKLKTVDDLVQSNDERVELINGEIVKRPMARSEHALIQSGISDEISLFKRKDGPGGWWIMPEISVKYSEHQCPCHDLAGWRKERVPRRPVGIMKVIPDWVCEITSPGHDKEGPVSQLYTIATLCPFVKGEILSGPRAVNPPNGHFCLRVHHQIVSTSGDKP